MLSPHLPPRARCDLISFPLRPCDEAGGGRALPPRTLAVNVVEAAEGFNEESQVLLLGVNPQSLAGVSYYHQAPFGVKAWSPKG